MTWISQYILPGFAVLVPALVGLFIIYWTRQALVASVRPQIECYLRPSSVRPDVCDFVLANEGLGSARNVSYRLDYDEQDFRDHTVIFRKRETDFPFQTGRLQEPDHIEVRILRRSGKRHPPETL